MNNERVINRPGTTDGMRHIALFVVNFEETRDFYIDLLGMEVEWKPDEENIYLTSGNDNLALHRVKEELPSGRLDHIGFFVNDIDKIDQWYEFLKSRGVRMFTEPKTHRDGARSFYCADPAGTRVQIIYHIPIAAADEQL